MRWQARTGREKLDMHTVSKTSVINKQSRRVPIRRQLGVYGNNLTDAPFSAALIARMHRNLSRTIRMGQIEPAAFWARSLAHIRKDEMEANAGGGI